MRRFLIATLLVLGGIANASAATFNVTLTSSLTFVPKNINIEVGDTVTWTNPAGAGSHNVFSDTGVVPSFTSGIPALGPWTFSHTFSSAGRNPYHCQAHGADGGSGMSGVVYVRATHAPNEHILQLNAWDLQPVDPTTTTASATGFFRTITAGNPELIAGVSLPTGTTITGIEMVACDTDMGSDISATLLKFAEPGTSPVTLATAATSAMPGCGFFSSAVIAESVQNLNNAYLVTVNETAPSPTTLSFRTVRIYYMTAISQPPLMATFTDVPTSHPFFRFVEALYAAGITAGCSTSPPQFCPDNPVTRGQMAVFLAAGLGLFFPN